MKIAKFTLVAFLSISLCFILFPFNGQAESNFGIGGEFLGNMPFLIGTLDINQLGIEVGGGIRSSGTSFGGYSTSLSMFYYLANGKYIFPLSEVLHPYVGGGLVGISASATSSDPTIDVTVNGQASGYDIFGGLEVPMKKYGLPLTIFGGLNYMDFQDMTFTYQGYSFTYPLNISGTSYHLGVKFVF